MHRTLEADLGVRREAVGRHGELARLAQRLERLAGGLLTGPIYLPAAKALLSRDGGVCPRDGARLAFHPYEPERHRCDRCGTVYEGERHHRAWAARYHIWLSERTVHLALLGALCERRDLSGRSAEILDACAARYRDYPNADNVLGPTRPFFSTYLESIWLAQLAVAATLLDGSAPDALAPSARRALRDVVTESAGLIASFDEGWSNRQVWHDTALLAAGVWLGRDDLEARASHGPGGLVRLLGAVGRDGLWHEGENYHLFALRGFLLGAEVLRWRGGDLYAGTRLGQMYAAPLDTLLPDLTLPARGDAPYGVSVRQPRFAEIWEMGRARTADPRLERILARLYATDGPELEDGGLAELAEQEWNRPGHRQYRDRLGWKALLWMRPEEPSDGGGSGESALFEDRGVAVLRDGDARTVMVECGGRHGGHAHPDRLHLSVHWHGPLLADFGTGSYVHPSLHWYRSALAHNVPMMAGAGQSPAAAACDAFAADRGWQWCRTRGDGILGYGTTVVRSVFLGPDVLLDVVRVGVPAEAVIDLGVHPLTGVHLPLAPAEPVSVPVTDAGHETGYDRIEVLGRATAIPSLTLGASGLALALAPRARETLMVARALGPPAPDFADGPPLTFLVRRAAGSGRWVHCLAPTEANCRIREDGPDLVVQLGNRHLRVIEGADGATIHEPGIPPIRFSARPAIPWPQPAEPPRPAPAGVRVPRVSAMPSLDAWPGGAAAFELGEAQYRRSELPYRSTEPFRARVEVVAWNDALCFRFTVIKSDLVVRPADAPDPALDNEPADIHSDGVQCYVGRERWAGFLVIPDLDRGQVRARPVAGTAARLDDIRGESRRTGDGYQVLVRCATGALLRPGDLMRFAGVVNEMRPGRERRAGQLALAGGGWVYLRGDRESPDAALTAEIA
jgi:hypothetical protein